MPNFTPRLEIYPQRISVDGACRSMNSVLSCEYDPHIQKHGH